jgi:tetrahydromethanopterin S-methyltransferase subunit G
MATVNERVDALEGQAKVISHALVRLEQRVELGFSETVRRFDAIDRRVEGIDGRLDRLDGRFDRLDERLDRLDGRLDRRDGRFERLEDKMSRQFAWTVGIQVTVLLAVIGALLSGRV